MAQSGKENGAEGTATHGRARFDVKLRLTDEARQRGRETQARRVAEWSKLDLKQDWLDEAHMIAAARRAGIAVLPNRLEPASARRLQRYARRMGILQSDLPHLVGFRRFEELITANPRYPLWALICHLAEVREVTA